MLIGAFARSPFAAIAAEPVARAASAFVAFAARNFDAGRIVLLHAFGKFAAWLGLWPLHGFLHRACTVVGTPFASAFAALAARGPVFAASTACVALAVRRTLGVATRNDVAGHIGTAIA